MNRCFDSYPFVDVVNKFCGAVCQGLDNNLLGNWVINLYMSFWSNIVQWDFTRRDHPENLGRVSGSGPIIVGIHNNFQDHS